MTSNIFEAIKHDPELWDTFTLKDEYEAGERDIYGRLPHSLSKHVRTIDPVVSSYLVSKGLDLKYPGGKKFAVCLTHDIDNLMITARTGISDSLKNLAGGNISGAISSIRSSISRKRNPLVNFDKIMDLEEKFGARSTFFFLSLARGEQDYNYDLKDFSRELKWITDRGFEIGLHGGHSTYTSEKRISDEKRKLERVVGISVSGYRNHFLRFKYPDTWRYLERAGFRYDSTMAYTTSVGWKNATCHPFIPFDRNRNEFLGIWEIPLAVMDRTLIGRLGLDHDNSIGLVSRLIDKVRQLNGVLTINWHNSEFSNENGSLYEKILKLAYDRGAWMVTASNLLDHISEKVSK